MKSASISWAAMTAVTLMTVPALHAIDFDHAYRSFAAVLRTHVVGARVDYAALQRNRAALDAVVEQFGRVALSDFESWTTDERIAYLVNAYNAFTLQAIVDHYPIDGGWLSFLRWAPRNSIKQIDGVWNERRWNVAGQALTLDDIEHGTLRAEYDEPRIHFALNCASVSCPRLREEPYTANALNRQLMLATRDFLASEHGARVRADSIWVSSLFSWFGDDFVDKYAHLVDGGSAQERAALGVIATYGPKDASQLAQSGRARVEYLDYDWGLNDVGPR